LKFVGIERDLSLRISTRSSYIRQKTVNKTKKTAA